jgi:hypothetical protein
MSEDRLRRAKNSKLPIASVIEDPEIFREVVSLLKESTDNKVKISEIEERQGAISERLAAICEVYNLPGIRHGLNAFEYHGWTTRKTLSKERLLFLGVSAETIDAAYVDSKPFLSTKIVPFDVLE